MLPKLAGSVPGTGPTRSDVSIAPHHGCRASHIAINTSVASADRHALFILDEGRERMIAQIYRRLRGRNHVPSRYESWEDGEWTKNIPIERVIGGPTFRNSASYHLLQMADLIAHALLKQEEEPYPRVERQGIARAFSILDKALNRRASRRDPHGIVKR